MLTSYHPNGLPMLIEWVVLLTWDQSKVTVNRVYMYGGNFYVDIKNGQFGCLFRQAKKFAKNILHTNITNLKASADVKISTFLEKMGDEAVHVDHEIDL